MKTFLKREEYMPYAPDEPGHSVRVNHSSSGCYGSSKSMKVERKEDGSVSAVCFRCGKSGGYRDDEHKYYKTKAKIKNSGAGGCVPVKRVYIPTDSTSNLSDWGASERAWIIKYGIDQPTVLRYGIRYSEQYERVLFPIYHDKQLIGWQGRSLDPSQPKYLSYTSDKDRFYYYVPNPSSDKVVVVEDALSAIRCGEVVNAIAILGTNMSDGCLSFISTTFDKVLIFLDDDNAQVKMKQVKLKNRLDFLCEDVKLITSVGRDPKELTKTELEDILL